MASFTQLLWPMVTYIASIYGAPVGANIQYSATMSSVHICDETEVNFLEKINLVKVQALAILGRELI